MEVGWYVIVPIKGGETYTISRKNGKSESSQLRLSVATIEESPDEDVTLLDKVVTDSSNHKKVTMHTSTNANYLFVGLAAGNTTEVTEEIQALAVEELQVEIGDSATEYEPHVENDILVKVNGGYISMFSELRESIKE